MKQKSSIPKIRFPEFSDEWKEYSMGELYSERKEPGNDFLPILSVSIHTGISDGELDEESLGKTVRRSEDKSTYKHVYPGDLVFNMMRAWQGAIGSAPSEGMISPAYISAMPNEKVYSPFMDYYVKRKEMIEQINSLSYGVTDFRKRLYWDSFIKVKCNLPSVVEQKRIADILKQYDRIIAIQEKKLGRLKNLKKGLLQKMFPEEGESAPEIRFPGYTDSWKQCKLDKVVTFFSGLTYSPADIRPSGTLVLRSSNVKDGEIIDADNVYVNPDVVNSENVKDGDIIVVVRNGSRALIGKHAEIKGEMPHTVIGAFMTGIRSERPSFVNALLNTSRFDKEIEKNMGATINQITGYMFSKMEFMIPSPDEQNVIGDFFKKLDNLIALHQCECNKYIKLKKGLLQQMSV